MSDTATYRLPRTVQPERYQIEIAPDLESSTFLGSERVEVRIHESVDRIVLHAAELSVSSARLSYRDGREDALEAAVSYDEDEEQLILELPRPAEPGEWHLDVEFSGTINDKLRGFYRSTFKDADGAEQVIATTQFEATDARRAFPCWDEPDRKATFAITLVIDGALAAFSNSAEESRQSRPDGKVAVRFHDTMKMSTYLVALVVGPLHATEAIDAGGVPLRVVHLPGKGHMCQFALEIGAHALRFFEAWFGIPYPGMKLDLIALPDFAFGAMENLGAVTFRETLLLLEPGASSHVEQERVADVVSHEIAHMWFGDLVTMKWWNGLWLNEAFATFMEILSVDEFRPDWDRWVTFGLSRGAALSVDSLSATRPIEFPVNRPEEAEGMFDVLTYEKGSAVLRMLQQYLGAEPFRQGIRSYLERHAHDNAETTDLWDSIESATGEAARAIMDSWIFQEGYPLLSVSATDQGLHLEQRRFLLSGEASSETTWDIPVLLRFRAGGREVEQRLLLDGRQAELDLGGRPEWVVANAGGWGFYRVRYQADLAKGIRSDLDRLDPLELFNLVSDTWAAALAGVGELADLPALVGRLHAGVDPGTWQTAAAALDFLHRVADGPGRDKVESFVRDAAGRALTELGWTAREGEPDKAGTLRSTLVSLLGVSGNDAQVRREAARLHAAVLADRSAADPDLLGALVTVTAAQGGPAEYEQFLERFHRPATPQEEIRYLYGLAGFQQPELVQTTLEMTLEEVRTQNAAYLISLLLANRSQGAVAWTFVKQNWDQLLDRLPQNSIVRMLEGLTNLHRPDLAADVEDFFTGHEVRSGRKTLDQILERLRINTAFARRHGQDIAAAF